MRDVQKMLKDTLYKIITYDSVLQICQICLYSISLYFMLSFDWDIWDGQKNIPGHPVQYIMTISVLQVCPIFVELL